MTEKTVTRSGESKNIYVWRGVMERQHARQRKNKQMKISRVRGVWILKVKGVCLYFPNLEELMRKAKMLLESL